MMLSKVVLSSLVIALLPAVCSAQDATGRIVGVVYDQQGRVIPDVQITVTNAATRINRRTVSDQEGYFQVLELSIGSYQVTSEHDGFRKTITAAEKLLINQTLRIDITMQVGFVFQTVIVDARPAPVETVNATLGQSVTSRPLVNLPLDGREVLNLAALQPGVTEGNDDNGGAGNFSIAGGRTDSVTYLLDGGLNNDLVNNAIVYDPNPDAIAEFRLLTSNYTAEYGRNGSGVISVVTKSGADQLHGSLFEFLRNDALNANTFFNNRDGLPRDILKRNQFGATLGGPIVIPHVIDGTHRFFFFVDYQGQRQVQTIAVNDAATFTAHELAGDFSLSDNGHPDAGVVCFLTGFDPDGVPCTDASGNTPGVAHTFFQPDPNKAKAGIIDPSRINGVAKAYIAAGLIPTSPTGLLSTQESARNDSNEVTTKLDCSVGPKDKLAATVGILRNPVFSPFVSSGVPGFPARFDFGTNFLNLAYMRIFSPSLLNEFHFVTHRISGTQGQPGRHLPTPTQLGIGITPDDPTGPTNLSFDTGLGIGFDEQGPSRIVDNKFIYTDTVSWTQGKHNWKFGGGFSASQQNIAFDFFVNGELDFVGPGGIGSQNSYADFLLGIPFGYSQGPVAAMNIRTKYSYGFAQDEWHLRKNLVLSLGLRYEYSTPKLDTQGRTLSIIPGDRSQVFTKAPVGLVFPGDAGAPRGTNFPDRNDFAPRFGFAWGPWSNSKLSVRGGFGVFYDILKAEDNLQFVGDPPFFSIAGLFFLPLSSNPSAELNYMRDPFAAAGVPNPFPSKPPQSNVDFAERGFLPFGSLVFVADPHLRTPFIYQYNLSVQYELPGRVVLESNYVGSSSHKLTSLQDANPMVLGTTDRILNLAPGNSSCTLTSGLCSFVAVPEFRNVSNANYNSLEFSLQRQVLESPLGTIYFTLAYTYGHNLDNVSGFRQRNASVPAYDTGLFYASSDTDIRQRISFSGGWDVPIDRTWAGGPKHLTQGWSLYPIVSWRTGFPFDISANLPGGPSDPGTSGAGDPQLTRANVVGPLTTLDPSRASTFVVSGTPTTGNFYFNPNSFSNAEFFSPSFDPVHNPSQRTYGSLPRNALRGPHQTNFDLALSKMTPLFGSRWNAEFRAEFFNILNHPQFGMPDGNLVSRTLGQVTYTGTARGGAKPRVVQLALRLIF